MVALYKEVGMMINRALLSSTKLQIYNKEKRRQVKVAICNRSMMESDILLFNPAKPKISHSRFRQDQVASMCVPSIIPVSMPHKDQKHCIKPVFLSHSF